MSQQKLDVMFERLDMGMTATDLVGIVEGNLRMLQLLIERLDNNYTNWSKTAENGKELLKLIQKVGMDQKIKAPISEILRLSAFKSTPVAAETDNPKVTDDNKLEYLSRLRDKYIHDFPGLIHHLFQILQNEIQTMGSKAAVKNHKEYSTLKYRGWEQADTLERKSNAYLKMENDQLKKDLSILELAMKRGDPRKAVPLQDSTAKSEANSTIIKHKHSELQEFIKNETVPCHNEAEQPMTKPCSELSVDQKYSAEFILSSAELNYDDNKGWGKLNVLSMKHFRVSAEQSTYYGTVRGRSNDYDMLNLRATNIFKVVQNAEKIKHEFSYCKPLLISHSKRRNL